ncbi:hypothetical protein PC119_g1136 [Phytophthora cactorum]|nr:hypothetical protein PC114_g3722 [Phytophthora cactorum]KAG3040877.1 hypothetical protein PC119_g1136 [Phytophthora cactorum]KAG3191322.1 hypothetical protein C6341_g1257 [Phytophthora cactorum]
MFAQMDVNYARMEVQGQPWSGWSVDLDSCWCPCNYWSVLVNRNKRKRISAAEDTQAGGPVTLDQR